MTSLSARLSEYLDHRRRFGADMTSVGLILKPFAAFADSEGAERVTTELFLRWKGTFGSAGPNTWAIRLGVVRSFATWLQGIDGRHEIPPKGLVRKCRTRPRPWICSEAETGRIVAAAAALPSRSGLRGATCSTLFGLIAATGLRIGEALGLSNSNYAFTSVFSSFSAAFPGGFLLCFGGRGGAAVSGYGGFSGSSPVMIVRITASQSSCTT